MPASTGIHCSRCVSQRGLMVDSVGVVLVAFASCLAALSPRAIGPVESSAVMGGGSVSGNELGYSINDAGSIRSSAARLNRLYPANSVDALETSGGSMERSGGLATQDQV